MSPVARKASGRQNERQHHLENADFEPTAEILDFGLYNSAFFRGSLWRKIPGEVKDQSGQAEGIGVDVSDHVTHDGHVGSNYGVIGVQR